NASIIATTTPTISDRPVGRPLESFSSSPQLTPRNGTNTDCAFVGNRTLLRRWFSHRHLPTTNLSRSTHFFAHHTLDVTRPICTQPAPEPRGRSTSRSFRLTPRPQHRPSSTLRSHATARPR